MYLFMSDTMVVPGQAVLPFAIWLHSGLSYSYLTFVL